jgi:CheY-like chemotaxis protein
MPQSENLILIVEDDQEVRHALKEIFTREGYDVVVVDNGADAIVLLDDSLRPRAVIIDLLLPGVIGHELLDYMRSEPELASIPIAIITGAPELAPPSHRVFAKPFIARELVSYVRGLVPIRPDPMRAT